MNDLKRVRFIIERLIDRHKKLIGTGVSYSIALTQDPMLTTDDLDFLLKELDKKDQTLRLAREGLLAAAAVVEKRSPAFKLIEAGLEAVNGVLNSSGR